MTSFCMLNFIKIYIGVIIMAIANNIYMLKIRGGNSYEE